MTSVGTYSREAQAAPSRVRGRSYWTALGYFAAAVTVPAGSIPLLITLSRDPSYGPLEHGFGWLLLLPCALVALAGWFMAHHRPWAAWTIRLVLLAALGVGAACHLFDVAGFAIPFISIAGAWLVLSFL